MGKIGKTFKICRSSSTRFTFFGQTSLSRYLNRKEDLNRKTSERLGNSRGILVKTAALRTVYFKNDQKWTKNIFKTSREFPKEYFFVSNFTVLWAKLAEYLLKKKFRTPREFPRNFSQKAGLLTFFFTNDQKLSMKIC